jgi:Arc/MetJ-type ribon-helix-helix transcriptional regulator
VVRANGMTTTMITAPKKRTTLDLPPALLQRTDEAVKLGVASSRNNLIAAAVQEYLDALDRAASIDARFAEMEEDAQYLRLHLELAAGFAESDAEPLVVDAEPLTVAGEGP